MQIEDDVAEWKEHIVPGALGIQRVHCIIGPLGAQISNQNRAPRHAVGERRERAEQSNTPFLIRDCADADRR